MTQETRCPEYKGQNSSIFIGVDYAQGFNPDEYILTPLNWRRAKRHRNRLMKQMARLNKKFGVKREEKLIVYARRISKNHCLNLFSNQWLGAHGYKLERSQ